MPDSPPQGTQPSAAESAKDHTIAWKPSVDRRQSWKAEDRKHAQHQPAMDLKTGPGFSEKARAASG